MPNKFRVHCCTEIGVPKTLRYRNIIHISHVILSNILYHLHQRLQSSECCGFYEYTVDVSENVVVNSHKKLAIAIIHNLPFCQMYDISLLFPGNLIKSYEKDY